MQQKKVFISFVEEDLEIAKIIRDKLRNEGISTWIYTEDNIVGDYRTGIIQAIAASKVMILIFSKHTEESPHIAKELREASEKNVIIIPFFIENIKKIKNENIRYEIQTLNWLHGWKRPTEEQINILIQKTKNIILPSTHSTPPTTPTLPPKKNWSLIIISLMLGLITVILALKLYLQETHTLDLYDETDLISPDLTLGEEIHPLLKLNKPVDTDQELSESINTIPIDTNITKTFKDNGILINITYPRFLNMNKSFTVHVDMINKNKTAFNGGGLTLSFPEVVSKKAQIIKSNFSSTRIFSAPDKMYHVLSQKNKVINYLAIEGWHNKKWNYKEKKSFSIKLTSAIDVNDLSVNVRGILRLNNKDLLNPHHGTKIDQQGYPVNQFKIEHIK